VRHRRARGISGGCRNRGGTITLLDPAGLKVDGVSYSSQQTTTEGTTIVF
jgi:hypothetical protein